MGQFNNEQKAYLKTLNVLYFEDDYLTSKHVIRYLHNYFDNIDYHETPANVFESIDFRKYDLVITDLNMPMMDGHTLIKRIKKINDKIDFLIISAYTDTEYLLTSIRLGVSGFIEKPMRLEDFEEALKRIVERRVLNVSKLMYAEDETIEL